MSGPIRRIADVESFALPQRSVREIFSARTGTSEGVGLRVVDLDPADPDRPRVPHVHERMEEALVVLAGAGFTWIDGVWHRVEAGDAWLVPAGAAHATLTPGPDTLRLLCFFPAGRPEDDVRELPDQALRLPADATDLA